jgi:Spy/CpxP family protein refolding chaperone
MYKKVYLLSIILISLFFSSPSFSQGNSGNGDKQFRGGFANELNLNMEQEDLISKMRLEHQSKMIDLTSELKKKVLEKKKILLNENISRDEMLGITREISEIKNKIELLRINHQMDIYDVLDANQKSTWKNLQLKNDGRKVRMKREMFDRM